MSVNGDVLDVARQRLAAEADAITALIAGLDEDFVRAAALILDTPGKVFIGGSGTSGAVARRMAHVFSVTGTPAVFLSPMDALHGASGAIGPADAVILISNGGASSEVIESARIAASHGARIIAITRGHETPLAREADHSLLVAVHGDADIGGTIATGITLAQSALGDALAEVLMRARGYTWAQFMHTHPAGAVGMREQLPEDLPRLELPGLDELPARAKTVRA
ncbi:KpsF/GutQ family sugar-phosphate isomerase [Homoserinibacter sp. YIM 151385]|uniref:KpsF/GutQ family sugar-phosphate isomerase n=1 Tax=Homoserinibacter sp. YIM 151385 TaxID=2985506 RepID=UPI0022F024B6|nr:SIS domain-containing protein [Homoserinibacter sp. YIM 151385]WBU36992.1 SIS domain-containing protein [Homoserinibacter sp. YIM 151385]